MFYPLLVYVFYHIVKALSAVAVQPCVRILCFYGKSKLRNHDYNRNSHDQHPYERLFNGIMSEKICQCLLETHTFFTPRVTFSPFISCSFVNPSVLPVTISSARVSSEMLSLLRVSISATLSLPSQ